MYQSKMQMQQENVDKGQLQITVVNSENGRPVENAVVRISYSGDPESTVEELRTDMQQENVDKGQLQITVVNSENGRPVENAVVRISYSGDPESTVEELRTDESGKTPVLDMKTPPLEYSMEPVEEQPYAEYTVQVEAEGFANGELRTDESGKTPVLDMKTPPLEYSMEPVEEQPYAEYTVQVEAEGFANGETSGTEVLPDVLAKQAIRIEPRKEAGPGYSRVVIGPHTLFGEYPPKIEEAEIKPINESGEIVLSRVVIPEFVVVHDGPVGDNSARNFYVRYRDYIKNVASSEIYATWPDDTIRANVLAICAVQRLY